ncbi:MAG: SLOG family protein [Candidatus Sericytochromatia bacterium]
MRVSITGSRGLKVSYSDIESHLPSGTTTIISGGATGIDTIASSFAKSKGYSLLVIKPDYSGSIPSRVAPLLRNTDIISQSDYCIFFWDGVSRGTKDTISKAIKSGKRGKVVVIGSCVVNSVIRF